MSIYCKPCAKCGKMITFIKTKKNKKWVPAEYPSVLIVQNNGGTCHSYITDEGEIIKGNLLPPNYPYSSPTTTLRAYPVHFENCPGAKEFRKREK